MRCRIVDISVMTAAEKEEFFRFNCPAGAIVQFPGHEMMYLGESNGDFYTINDVDDGTAALDADKIANSWKEIGIVED